MLLNTVGSPRSLSVGHVHSAIMSVGQSELYGLHWALEAIVINFPDPK